MPFSLFDLALLVVMLRALFVGYQKGLIIEVMKLLSVILTMFFAMHYYVLLADFLLKLPIMDKNYSKIFSFGVITGVGFLFFWLVRQGWLLILKAKWRWEIDKTLATVVSFFRGFLLCELLFIGLLIWGQPGMLDQIHRSWSKGWLEKSSLSFYETGYKVLKIISPREDANSQIFLIVRQAQEAEAKRILQPKRK